MMNRITISISPELDAALDVAAAQRQLSKSRLIETFLREHETMRPVIAEVRAEAKVTAYAASRRAVARRAKG